MAATETIPHTRKILDISTTHLPREMGAELNGTDGVVAYRLEYGWLMWVPSDPADSDCMSDEVPPEILAIQLYARSHGCDYVLFDRDAETDPNLRTWDW